MTTEWILIFLVIVLLILLVVEKNKYIHLNDQEPLAEIEGRLQKVEQQYVEVSRGAPKGQTKNPTAKQSVRPKYGSFSPGVVDISNQGSRLMNNGDYEGALERYYKAKELSKSDPFILKAIGQVYFLKKDYKKAIDTYCEAAMILTMGVDLASLSSESGDMALISQNLKELKKLRMFIKDIAIDIGYAKEAIRGADPDPYSYLGPMVDSQQALRVYMQKLDPRGYYGDVTISKETLKHEDYLTKSSGCGDLMDVSFRHNAFPALHQLAEEESARYE